MKSIQEHITELDKEGLTFLENEYSKDECNYYIDKFSQIVEKLKSNDRSEKLDYESIKRQIYNSNNISENIKKVSLNLFIILRCQFIFGLGNSLLAHIQ